MRLNEQNNGTVILDGTMRQLPMLTAWKNSSAVYWIVPNYPVAEMYLKVGGADGKSWVATVKAYCHPKRGRFHAYVQGRHFAGGRYETKYQVVTIDENGAKHVEGEGVLRVYESAIPDYEPEQIVACAMWPDGKVREVTIREDETGAPVFSIGDVTDKEVTQGEIYAHNNASGLFHLVTTFIDEENEPMLSVSDNPVNGGFDQFVADKSGFYRRIECGTDASGFTTLKTGEQQL